MAASTRRTAGTGRWAGPLEPAASTTYTSHAEVSARLAALGQRLGRSDGDGEVTRYEFVTAKLAEFMLDDDEMFEACCGSGRINMVEVKDAGVPASQQSLSTDEFEFQFSLCVHGLHVDEEKGLHKGPKILVPSDSKTGRDDRGGGVSCALSRTALSSLEVTLVALITSRILVGDFKLGGFYTSRRELSFRIYS